MIGRSKKSEMLEVRLSFEDKEALRAKAAFEGSTVSATVRRLIANYLRQPEAEAVHPLHKRLFMTLLTNPRKSLLAAGSFLLPALILAPTAMADPITLSIKIEESTPVEEVMPDGKSAFGLRVKRHTTAVEFDKNGEFCIPIGRAVPCKDDDDFHIILIPKQTDRGIEMTLKVVKNSEIVSERTLFMTEGETASFLSGAEVPVGSAEDGYEFQSYGISLEITEIES